MIPTCDCLSCVEVRKSYEACAIKFERIKLAYDAMKATPVVPTERLCLAVMEYQRVLEENLDYPESM